MGKEKILVTGSNGQLGKELQKITNLYADYEFIFHDIDTLDICSPESIAAVIPQDTSVIINCAAYTAVDKAETEELIAEKVNADGVRFLAAFAKKHNIHLIHISTDYVFDGKSHIPYKEIDKTNPVSAYGRTKLAGEQAIKLSGCNATIIRTSWLYSSFGNNFVKTILRLGSEREQLSIVSDQIGTPTYAADLASAILTACQKRKEGFYLYHFANEGVCSWYDFAKEILTLSKSSCKILPIETKDYPTLATRPAYSVFDKQKIKVDLDIEIPHWKDSLIICLQQIV